VPERTLLAFDVNETLLDLSALDEPFARAFGDASLRPAWFQLMLQLAFVGGLSGRYVDFTSAQRAALAMLAARTRVVLDEEAASEIVATMERLPAHPDVAPALRRLREAGFRQVTLTNSPLAVARAQLEFAGLHELLDGTFSADEVQALKPRPEPYRLVAERTGMQVAEVRLVAAHAWDVSGALASGARAAFIARGGAVPSPLGPQPDIVAGDLGELADRLIGAGERSGG
jgi:2-haloacid dehalogenase